MVLSHVRRKTFRFSRPAIEDCPSTFHRRTPCQFFKPGLDEEKVRFGECWQFSDDFLRAHGSGKFVAGCAAKANADFSPHCSAENLSSSIREFNQDTILVPAALVTQGVIVSV